MARVFETTGTGPVMNWGNQQSAALNVLGSGDPVLLLHGTPASKVAWSEFQNELAAEFRTIAVDLLGYGEAPQPERPETFSLDDEIDYLQGVLEPFAPLLVVGVSYGAAVGLHLALRRPERVRGLALFEPISYYLLEASAHHERFAQLMATIEERWRAGDDQGALRLFFDGCGGAGLYDRLPAYVHEIAAGRLAKVMLDYRAALRLPPSMGSRKVALERLSALDMPMLVLHTETTGALEKGVVELLRKRTGCRTFEMEGRHSAFVLRADETNAKFADFLRSTQAPGGGPTGSGGQ